MQLTRTDAAIIFADDRTVGIACEILIILHVVIYNIKHANV